MFLYAIVWWFLPILALIIFFFISIHHFGQSNFENTKVFYLPSIFWGGWVLLYPVFIHSNEAFTIFKQMIAANNFNIEIIKYPINDKFKFIILGGFSLFYFLILRYFEKENLLKYFLQFVIVTIWYLFTPLLFGFIIFFCLWHSLQSLNHQSEYYLEISKNNLADFVLKMVPFSLIALGLFGIYVYIRGFILSEAFILLSLITFPHVIIMHKLYKKAPLGLIK
jgi:Brp/Blh family beta-carotene 15,15'-monooxygenase